MSDEKKQLKHDMLNCLAIIKANIDLIETEKGMEEITADMKSAVEELEQKIPIILSV